MSRRRLFPKKNPSADASMSLQITSMADVFTILLVFLLKGVASDVLQVNPSSATRLPSATSSKPLPERALQVEITPTEVLVEKESVGSHAEFKNRLIERLQEERKRNGIIAKANPTVKTDSRAIVLADEKIPYQLIRSVLGSLSKTGYHEIHFAVLEK